MPETKWSAIADAESKGEQDGGCSPVALSTAHSGCYEESDAYLKQVRLFSFTMMELEGTFGVIRK